MFNAAWAISFGPSVFGRLVGLTSHPNHLGMVCMLGSGLALGVIVGRVGRSRWLALACLPPLLAALVLSGSRAAVIGCLFVVLAMAWLCRRVQVAMRALIVAASVWPSWVASWRYPSSPGSAGSSAVRRRPTATWSGPSTSPAASSGFGDIR